MEETALFDDNLQSTPVNPFKKEIQALETTRKRLVNLSTTNPFMTGDEFTTQNTDSMNENTSLDGTTIVKPQLYQSLNPFKSSNPFVNPNASAMPQGSNYYPNPFERDDVTHMQINCPQVGNTKKFSKPIKFPADYDGSQNLRDYLRHFKHCSVLNGWNEEESGVFLAAGLRGEAQKVLSGLSESESCCYKKIVDRLELRFGVETQRELHQARLHSRRQKDGESAQVLASDIRSMSSLAYQDLPQEAQERFAVQHFIDAIRDPDDRLRLRREKPKTIDSALSLACELEAFRLLDCQHQTGMAKIRAVEEPLQKDIDNLRQQILAQQQQLEKQNEILQKFISQTQDLKSPCPSKGEAPKPRPSTPGNSRIQCWNCKELGHIRSRCPHQSTYSGQRNMSGNGTWAPPKTQGDA